MRLQTSSLLSMILLVATGCGGAMDAAAATKSRSRPKEKAMLVSLRVPVIDADGKLSGPVEVPAVVLSDAEWRQRLTPEQYRITRSKNTEAAFCGGLLNNKEPGIYVCVCCNLPLFESKAKFHSGSGWPSFFELAAKENIVERRDTAITWSAPKSLLGAAGRIFGTSSTTARR